jgi:cell shape-determining protein MreC
MLSEKSQSHFKSENQSLLKRQIRENSMLKKQLEKLQRFLKRFERCEKEQITLNQLQDELVITIASKKMNAQ